MKQSTTVDKLAWLVVITLILLPFHAFLTVWLSSLIGHYTLLRLWKEFLLIPILIGAIYILINDKGLRQKIINSWLVRLMTVYASLLLLLAFIPWARHDVTPKAMWYGLLVDLRFLVFFVVVLILAAKSRLLFKNWPKILFVPAILVAAFAILQYLILPYDFLKHFGYSDSTIAPYETINRNIQHIRVISTLRGANPLGAYLILPISALTVLLIKNKPRRFKGIFLAAGLLMALIFSFSRSAWIGTVLSVAMISWLSLRSAHARKVVIWVLATIVIASAALAMILRNNSAFENIVFHTERNSKVAISSNEQHASAFKSAISDIIHQPLGVGVGTAGPQSVYNGSGNARIAENYFLQIGQEAGVIAMLLFIVICVMVGKKLYERRTDPLALALFASLIGITFVNLLSHAWADDTLAYIWWGLAGVALAPRLK